MSPCCGRDRPSLALVAVPGRDIAPDVVYAVRSAIWARNIGADSYVNVVSRPVIIPPRTNWELL